MKYPDFIKKNDLIGITAPSAGVGRDLLKFDASLARLANEGYRIKESKSVRVNSLVSNTAEIRAAELKELAEDKEVKMIIMATGGDFMYELMPQVDFASLLAHPKWLMGYSDPTNLLFTLTVRYDLATIYGFNAGDYANGEEDQLYNLRLLHGDIGEQKNYPFHQVDNPYGNNDFSYHIATKWQGEARMKGRLIGGCMDILAVLIGTEFGMINPFLEKYKEDGFIWYFDIYSLSSLNFYLHLLQFKYAGWFKYLKGIVLGRVCMPNIDTIIDYREAVERALPGVPLISEADIGHVRPSFTLINGAIGEFSVKNSEASLRMELK